VWRDTSQSAQRTTWRGERRMARLALSLRPGYVRVKFIASGGRVSASVEWNAPQVAVNVWPTVRYHRGGDVGRLSLAQQKLAVHASPSIGVLPCTSVISCASTTAPATRDGVSAAAGGGSVKLGIRPVPTLAAVSIACLPMNGSQVRLRLGITGSDRVELDIVRGRRAGDLYAGARALEVAPFEEGMYLRYAKGPDGTRGFHGGRAMGRAGRRRHAGVP
jgi:hypothetical protein